MCWHRAPLRVSSGAGANLTFDGYFFLLDFRELLRGTFAPFFRASLSPIAMACLRLVTFRPDPLFRVPFFLRCIADLTVFAADFPYFAIFTSATPVAKYVLAR